MPDSSACAMLRAHLCDERDTCTIILHNARTLLNFQPSFCICAIMRNVYYYRQLLHRTEARNVNEIGSDYSDEGFDGYVEENESCGVSVRLPDVGVIISGQAPVVETEAMELHKTSCPLTSQE